MRAGIPAVIGHQPEARAQEVGYNPLFAVSPSGVMHSNSSPLHSG